MINKNNCIILRIEKENLSLEEQVLLQSALGMDFIMKGEYSDAFTIFLQVLEEFKNFGDVDKIQADIPYN